MAFSRFFFLSKFMNCAANMLISQSCLSQSSQFLSFELSFNERPLPDNQFFNEQITGTSLHISPLRRIHLFPRNGAYDHHNQYTTRKTAMQALSQEFIILLRAGFPARRARIPRRA
jgi:hypothetical protein